jgi:hypothetical protein
MSENAADAEQPTTNNQPTKTEDGAAALAKYEERIRYLESENKKAFEARDKAKREAAELKASAGNGPPGWEEFMATVTKDIATVKQAQANVDATSKFDRDLAAAGVHVDAAQREEAISMYSSRKTEDGVKWLQTYFKPATATVPKEQAPAPPSTPSGSVDRATNLPSNPVHVDKALWFGMTPAQRRAHTEKFLQQSGYGGSSAFRKG